MIEKIIEIDKQLLVYLHGLSSESTDWFWVFITKQMNWLPLYLLILYWLYKKLTLKQLITLLIVITLFFVFTDQFTNLVKNTVGRLRPINDPTLEGMVRRINGVGTASKSFFSGHASNSLGAILILFLVLKKHYKLSFLLFLFPLLFAYTRIHLALHFPTDILVGYTFGAISGLVFYTIYLKICRFYQK